jgi:molecular chaperone DnaK
MCDALFDRTKRPVRECLKEAKVTPADIDELVLVGGMTRMPKVIEVARELAGKEPHKGVNPDEVVAVGAAIQGGVLQGDVKDVLLLDVTPLTLAIETAGGIATPMIPRNTTIPKKASQVFSTYADNQPGVEIVVLQGERPMSRDNKTLGTFKLEGIDPAPRGTPQIEVTFDIDANGILHVSARDKKTGKEQKISIAGSSGLSPDEIEAAKRAAEEHAEEDRKRRDTVEAKNTADSLVYQVEKQLAELGGHLNDDQKRPVTEAVGRAKRAIETDNIDEIRSATDALQQRLIDLGAMAAAASATSTASTAAPGAEGAAGTGDEEPEMASAQQAKGKVVDADFEVVDEDKK